MKTFYVIPFLLFLLLSCKIQKTENYYIVSITEDALVYAKDDLNSICLEEVKVGEPIYMILDKSKKGFRKVKYKGKTGYVYRPSFKAYAPSSYRAVTSNIGKDSTVTRSTRTYTPATSSGGTVHVKGYYRKNGTYVKPHTRSAPRRR
ncbi:hypothetical protein [Sphingobacterium hotanense]|uniref:hypothetical protein n=1 Tax=Sphingobacterium hotanense TaxID=649196 RepID=UPI0021A61098|nr:hypothetical protein [Sphingobacterium hotanense]MCT1525412.1 hypothetical protein [Sphingobacterium hotanense]